jgi:hypothetical protein
MKHQLEASAKDYLMEHPGIFLGFLILPFRANFSLKQKWTNEPSAATDVKFC